MVRDPSRRRLALADRLIEVIDERQTGETLLDEALKMMKSSEKYGTGAWVDLMSGKSAATGSDSCRLIVHLHSSHSLLSLLLSLSLVYHSHSLSSHPSHSIPCPLALAASQLSSLMTRRNMERDENRLPTKTSSRETSKRSSRQRYPTYRKTKFPIIRHGNPSYCRHECQRGCHEAYPRSTYS
jgi:hypothetical protein